MLTNFYKDRGVAPAFQVDCFYDVATGQLMYNIANEKPVNIQSINPAVPENLVKTIQRALAKDIALRFQTGREMAQALRDCRIAFVTVDVAL
jgi:hypothetical protein